MAERKRAPAKRSAAPRIATGASRGSGPAKGLFVTADEIKAAADGNYFIMVKAPVQKRNPDGTGFRQVNRPKGQQTPSSIIAQWNREITALTKQFGRLPTQQEIVYGTYFYLPALRIGGLLSDLAAAQIPANLAPNGIMAYIDANNNPEMLWNVLLIPAGGPAGLSRFAGEPPERWIPLGLTTSRSFVEAIIADRARKAATPIGLYDGIPLRDVLWLKASLGRGRQGVKPTIELYNSSGNRVLADERQDTKSGLSRYAVNLLDKARDARAKGKFLDVSNITTEGRRAVPVDFATGGALPAEGKLRYNAGSGALNIYSKQGLEPILATLNFARRAGDFENGSPVLNEIVNTTNAIRRDFNTGPPVSEGELANSRRSLAASMSGTRAAAPAAAPSAAADYAVAQPPPQYIGGAAAGGQPSPGGRRQLQSVGGPTVRPPLEQYQGGAGPVSGTAIYTGGAPGPAVPFPGAGGVPFSGGAPGPAVPFPGAGGVPFSGGAPGPAVPFPGAGGVPFSGGVPGPAVPFP